MTCPTLELVGCVVKTSLVARPPVALQVEFGTVHQGRKLTLAPALLPVPPGLLAAVGPLALFHQFLAALAVAPPLVATPLALVMLKPVRVREPALTVTAAPLAGFSVAPALLCTVSDLLIAMFSLNVPAPTLTVPRADVSVTPS